MHAAYDNREHTINSQNKYSTHTQYPAHPFFKFRYFKISFNTSSVLEPSFPIMVIMMVLFQKPLL